MTALEVARDLARARCFGMCEGCRGFGSHLDAHHRRTRGSGGVHGVAATRANDVRNLLMLCRPCHDRTLDHHTMAECIGKGWVIERRSGMDPFDTPALIYTVNGYGWWYLVEDGSYLWAGLPDEYRIDLTPEGEGHG